MSFNSVIVWKAPFRAYGFISGYQIRLFNFEAENGVPGQTDEETLPGSVLISKNRDELFHVLLASEVPSGNGEVFVQVSTVN